MRRSLARRAIAFTSASVGRRSTSRSVSRTQRLASCNVGVGISCSIQGSWRSLLGYPAFSLRDTRNKKGRPVSRLPFGAFTSSAGSTGPGGLKLVHRLLGRSFRHRDHRHEGAAIGFCTKLNSTLDLGKQSMVSAHADIKAGVPGGAEMPRVDVAGNHVFAAIGLDAQALARRIPAVTRLTACFFVSHGSSPTLSIL